MTEELWVANPNMKLPNEISISGYKFSGKDFKDLCKEVKSFMTANHIPNSEHVEDVLTHIFCERNPKYRLTKKKNMLGYAIINDFNDK